MARRSISIDEKIQQQKQVVSSLKTKYDAALSELERLMQKRDEARNKELVKAFTASDRTFDEIMAFLQGGEPEG